MDNRQNTSVAFPRWWILIPFIVLAVYYLGPRVSEIISRQQAGPRAITPRGDLSAKETTTIEIFRQASPSVVYITTLTRNIDPWTRNVMQIPSGTGSGFVWDNNGHIVTNFHVISGAQAAQVRLEDQRSFSASLVGASPEHDLAVLYINVTLNQPPPVNIGASNNLQVGQDVFAIGTPFGLDRTLTTGIISALNRSIATDNGREISQLIQTDAAINPGNSGGPLLDSSGRLIGINTAIISPSGAYSGIGFAVPVDTVNRVVPQLIRNGRYQRPVLGIGVDDQLSEIVARDLGIDGILILSVEPGSPAEKAGLKGSRLLGANGIAPGDFVLAVDDRKVTNLEDLLDVLDEYSVGDTVKLTIRRNDQTLSIPVTLAASKNLTSRLRR